MPDTERLFSIVIPTRNRFATAKKTILSAINQSFNSFEVIISDNSTSQKGLLKDWIKNLKIKSDVHFYETESDLEMHDNWEQSTLKASGKYILVLPDRWVMRLGVLSLLNKIIEKNDPEVIFWDTKLGMFANGYIKGNKALANGQVNYTINKSNYFLEKLLDFNGYKDESVFRQKFPRGLNSLYREDVARKIRSMHGSLFSPLSCDYTSGVKILLGTSEIIYLQESMYVAVGNDSNGHNSAVNGGINKVDLKYKHFFDWRGLILDSVFLTVMNDIETVISTDQNGKKYLARINKDNVILSIMYEIHYKEFHGTQLDTKLMRKKIFDYIEREPGFRKKLKREVCLFDKDNKPKYIWLRFYLNKHGLLKKIFLIKENIHLFLQIIMRKGHNISEDSLANSPVRQIP